MQLTTMFSFKQEGTDACMFNIILIPSDRRILEKKEYLIEERPEKVTVRDKFGETLFILSDENNSGIITVLLKNAENENNILYCNEVTIFVKGEEGQMALNVIDTKFNRKVIEIK